jgi:hypothetical protein
MPYANRCRLRSANCGYDGIKQILTWATVHYRRTGVWPNSKSGRIAEAPAETWDGINWSLTKGRRGLRATTSLHWLICEHRGTPPRERQPVTKRQILRWADAYYERMGKWPSTLSGPIAETPSRTWSAINQALRNGYSGLAGSSSLSKLLARPAAADSPVTASCRATGL